MMIKQIVYILLFSLVLFSACKKEEPVIATPDELASRTLSEFIICQPVAYKNNIVALVNDYTSNNLCSYDANGEKLWQQNVDNYLQLPFTFQNIFNLKLEKDKKNNLLLYMNTAPLSPVAVKLSQYFKALIFDQQGNNLGQLKDSVHQPDKIIIDQDIINLTNIGSFAANGFVSLSDGNYLLISSLKNKQIDSTYLQFTYYNYSSNLVTDQYFKIPALREFKNIYTTSDDHLLMVTTIPGKGAFLLMTDLKANIVFDKQAQGLLDTYFFFENSKGEYMLSASYADANAILRGVLLDFSLDGTTGWQKVFDMNPSAVILSVQEQSDGYIFSGFNTASLLLTGVDWRTSFLQEEHHAFIIRTDLNGNEQWRNLINGVFFSAGAVTIGDSTISLFGGKYDNSVKNVFVLKLTSTGEIFN